MWYLKSSTRTGYN
ncbi:hypothetical protein VCHENC02_2012A, partial [Vibrio harveyi]